MAFKVNFVCLTETWLLNNNNSVHLNEFKLGSLFNRISYKGGGTAVYVRKSIVYDSLKLFNFYVAKDFEICGIRITINEKNTLLQTC